MCNVENRYKHVPYGRRNIWKTHITKHDTTICRRICLLQAWHGNKLNESTRIKYAIVLRITYWTSWLNSKVEKLCFTRGIYSKWQLKLRSQNWMTNTYVIGLSFLRQQVQLQILNLSYHCPLTTMFPLVQLSFHPSSHLSSNVWAPLTTRNNQKIHHREKLRPH